MRGRDPVQGEGEGRGKGRGGRRSFQSALGMIAKFDTQVDSTTKGLGQSMVATAPLFARLWRKCRDGEWCWAQTAEKRWRERT
jgi:hypothetical protein